ncbi:MAG: GIY-YIG nuclease family protein [Rikenellaceae bacterium]
MKLTINELLETRGITEKDGVKFIRHQFSNSKEGVDFYNPETGKDERLENFVTIEDFYRNRKDDFIKYQNTQLSSNFKGVNYIVSFIAESGKRARFVGVYKLDGEPITIPDTLDGKSKSYYNFVEIDILGDLKERIIIDWVHARGWHEWMKNKKEIVLIGDPLGDLPFPGYMDFTLSRQELERVFEFEYKEWKNALTAVNCIYLITDTNTGQYYVGSTYNTDGIWGRWKSYNESIHGNTKELKKLIKENGESYKINLQYTILEILPLNIIDNKAIERENLYKKKLNSKDLGLNAN